MRDLRAYLPETAAHRQPANLWKFHFFERTDAMRTKRIPKYCKHKSSGHAYTRVHGRQVWLGAFGNTRIRGEFGLDAAQVILGHSHARITEIYGEADAKQSYDAVEVHNGRRLDHASGLWMAHSLLGLRSVAGLDLQHGIWHGSASPSLGLRWTRGRQCC